MRKTIAAALIAVSAATAACGQVRDEYGDNGGATVSRNYQVRGFNQIEVAGPYDVEVRTGSSPTVSARGSEKLLERTVVEVRGDKLFIGPKQEGSWFHIGWSTHGHANFAVTVPQLSCATIAGSGGIKVDHVAGNRFEGTVAGSGDLNVGTMDVQSLKLAIAGSGGVKAGAGKAQSADYDIAGSGDLDAGAIATQQVKVSIAGSGGVRAHSSGTADVSIMGSGDVNVAGGAKCNVSKMGSGKASCS
jgi:putative autotransporter adhesin-like protein